MKKQICISLIVIATIGLSQTVNAQNFDALRYTPNISEDEIIFCVKDVKHKDYFGQISCFISPSDDLLDQKTSDKIYNKASSLDDTFEMGLVD
jgi:hypothetical protein